MLHTGHCLGQWYRDECTAHWWISSEHKWHCSDCSWISLLHKEHLHNPWHAYTLWPIMHHSFVEQNLCLESHMNAYMIAMCPMFSFMMLKECASFMHDIYNLDRFLFIKDFLIQIPMFTIFSFILYDNFMFNGMCLHSLACIMCKTLTWFIVNVFIRVSCLKLCNFHASGVKIL